MLPNNRKDAKEQGLKKYKTDRPCKHGHYAIRYTLSSACTECIGLSVKADRLEIKKIRAMKGEEKKEKEEENKSENRKENKEESFPLTIPFKEETKAKTREQTKKETQNKLKEEDSKSFALKIPFKEIVKLYHEMLPELPECKKLTESRKSFIRGRWVEDGMDSLERWGNFYHHVKQSDFLMGRVEARNDRYLFRANLEWITRPANFVKILEKNYDNKTIRKANY